MKMFIVTYRETYERTYGVEADTAEEAQDTLRWLIAEGHVSSPDECVDSEMTAEEGEYP